MALTSRSGTCINHGPALFSASLLITFVSCARDQGRRLSIYSQSTLYTSCQLTEQYIKSFKMWQEQLLRRNLLKKETDFGEICNKFLLWGCKSNTGKVKSQGSLWWINMKSFNNILTAEQLFLLKFKRSQKLNVFRCGIVWHFCYLEKCRLELIDYTEWKSNFCKNTLVFYWPVCLGTPAYYPGDGTIWQMFG